jgi:hypothetical protein
MSFPIYKVRLNSLSYVTKIKGCFEISKYFHKKKSPLLGLFYSFMKLTYLTFSTIALKASGWLAAKSASTLRLISIPAECKAPIKRE